MDIARTEKILNTIPLSKLNLLIIQKSPLKKFLDMLDGQHCLDEVCCETNKNLKEVLMLIGNIREAIVLYK